MKQVKVGNKLYVLDTEAYEITEDTDVGIILVPEDSYEDYVSLNPTLTLTKYNYNVFMVTTPEWDSPEPPTPTKETRLVVKYNVESTSQPTALYMVGDPEGLITDPIWGAVDFSAIEIDGEDVAVSTIDNSGCVYQFTTTGEHTVKYTLVGNSISNYRFTKYIRMSSVFIPSGLTDIGYSAFDNYVGTLNNIVIDDDNPNYTSNGESGNCIVEKSTHTLLYISNNTVIPDDVLIISDYVGSYNENITELIIPNSVTTIGESCFSYSNLETLTIGSGVTQVGSDAFSGCDSLSTVTIYGTNDLSYDLPLGSVTTLYVDSSMIQTYEDAKEDMGYEYTVLPIQ